MHLIQLSMQFLLPATSYHWFIDSTPSKFTRATCGA